MLKHKDHMRLLYLLEQAYARNERLINGLSCSENQQTIECRIRADARNTVIGDIIQALKGGTWTMLEIEAGK